MGVVSEDEVDGADIVILAYGISSRVVRPAVDRARKEGIKVGLLKLITVWPFPEKRVRELAEQDFASEARLEAARVAREQASSQLALAEGTLIAAETRRPTGTPG